MYVKPSNSRDSCGIEKEATVHIFIMLYTTQGELFDEKSILLSQKELLFLSKNINKDT